MLTARYLKLLNYTYLSQVGLLYATSRLTMISTISMIEGGQFKCESECEWLVLFAGVNRCKQVLDKDCVTS